MTLNGNEHLFKNVEFDPRQYQDTMKKPPARINYVIYFTPRSGSSWLTDVLVQTKRMSLANEAFNPNFIPDIARSLNASNIDQYVNALKRKHNNHGVYGFEITWHQLNLIFPQYDTFIEYFGTNPAFWLIRRNIVAQAVSLAKMVTTNITHAPHSSEEERAAAELAFPYDKALIKYWLLHILVAERKSETLFADHCITPLRLCYEDMIATGAERVARVMMQHVGATWAQDTIITSHHEKLATLQNAEYADRFRSDCADFLHDVEQERSVWLNKVIELGV